MKGMETLNSCSRNTDARYKKQGFPLFSDHISCRDKIFNLLKLQYIANYIMFTILIPILACLAGMQATKAGQDFKEPVTVQFVIKDWEHTAKNYGWRDWSTYESPELKELGTIPDAVGDVVGSLVFKHADDPDAHRVITWIKDKSDKTLRQVSITCI
jgi:hypothetical protein